MNKRQKKDFYGNKLRHKKFAFMKSQYEAGGHWVRVDNLKEFWKRYLGRSTVPSILPCADVHLGRYLDIVNTVPERQLEAETIDMLRGFEEKVISRLNGTSEVFGAKITERYNSKDLPNIIADMSKKRKEYKLRWQKS